MSTMLMRLKNSLAFFGLLCGACGTKTSDKEYLDTVHGKKGGFMVEQQVEQIYYSMRFVPKREICIQEHLSGDAAARRVMEMEGVQRFVISLQSTSGGVAPLKMGVGDEQQYNERLAYFLTKAQQDIFLQIGDKKYSPISYQFEHNYGLTPADAMIVIFETLGAEEELGATLEYRDRVFKNGIVKAFFPAKKFIEAKKL